MSSFWEVRGCSLSIVTPAAWQCALHIWTAVCTSAQPSHG